MRLSNLFRPDGAPRRTGAAVVSILLAAGLLASLQQSATAAGAAVATERGALIIDARGDGPGPQRDLVAVEVNSDPNEGRFWGYVEMATAPTAATVAEYRVYYGNWVGNSGRSEIRVSGRTAKSEPERG